jgi:hypothetical protein
MNINEYYKLKIYFHEVLPSTHIHMLAKIACGKI